MTKLEKAIKELNETLTPDQLKIVDATLKNVNLPTNVKVNFCKSILDGSISLSSLTEDKHVNMTDAEIDRLDIEIQNGGKPKLLEILDKVVNTRDPKFKQLMVKYNDLLLQLRADSEAEKLKHFEKKKREIEEIKKKRSQKLNKIIS